MLLSQLFPDLSSNEEDGVQVDWCSTAYAYPNHLHLFLAVKKGMK